MTEHWTTSELPGLLWDDDAEPPDDNEPGGPRITTIHLVGDLL